MDFGALSSSTVFDPRIAEIHPGSIALLKKRPIYSHSLCIGAPQWNIPGFSGKNSLEKYARAFNSIELNTSFYQIPDPEIVKRWSNQSSSDFQFIVKVHQGITHDPVTRFHKNIFSQRLEKFIQAWSHLGNKWSGSFLQLGSDFEVKDINVLEYWVGQWPESLPLFVEFRHSSWFHHRALVSEAARLLARYHMGTVCSDTPGRRDVSHCTLTTNEWMVRFLCQTQAHDSQLLTQDLERLASWADRTKELFDLGLKRLNFFIHTPDQAWVPELTKRFYDLLPEFKTQLTQNVSPAQPTQASFIF